MNNTEKDSPEVKARRKAMLKALTPPSAPKPKSTPVKVATVFAFALLATFAVLALVIDANNRPEDPSHSTGGNVAQCRKQMDAVARETVLGWARDKSTRPEGCAGLSQNDYSAVDSAWWEAHHTYVSCNGHATCVTVNPEYGDPVG